MPLRKPRQTTFPLDFYCWSHESTVKISLISSSPPSTEKNTLPVIRRRQHLLLFRIPRGTVGEVPRGPQIDITSSAADLFAWAVAPPAGVSSRISIWVTLSRSL